MNIIYSWCKPMFAKTKILKPPISRHKSRFLMSAMSVLLATAVAAVLLTASPGTGEKAGLEFRNVNHAYDSAGRGLC